MKLIDNWRAAWRMFTMQIAALALTFGLMSADLQSAVLDAIGVPPSRVPAIIGGLFIVGRLIRQPAVQEGPP